MASETGSEEPKNKPRGKIRGQVEIAGRAYNVYAPAIVMRLTLEVGMLLRKEKTLQGPEKQEVQMETFKAVSLFLDKTVPDLNYEDLDVEEFGETFVKVGEVLSEVLTTPFDKGPGGETPQS